MRTRPENTKAYRAWDPYYRGPSYRCSECTVWRDYAGMAHVKGAPHGVYHLCRECYRDYKRAYYKKNKPVIRASYKTWYGRNADRIKALKKEKYWKRKLAGLDTGGDAARERRKYEPRHNAYLCSLIITGISDRYNLRLPSGPVNKMMKENIKLVRVTAKYAKFGGSANAPVLITPLESPSSLADFIVCRAKDFKDACKRQGGNLKKGTFYERGIAALKDFRFRHEIKKSVRSQASQYSPELLKFLGINSGL